MTRMKPSLKLLIMLAVSLFAIYIFGATEVKAVTEHKCNIEKDNYIISNNYFNTKDVKITCKEDESYVDICVKKSNIDQSIFNDLAKDCKFIFLVEITADITEAKIDNTNLEIIEKNNKRYVAVELDYTNCITTYKKQPIQLCTAYENVVEIELIKDDIISKKSYRINLDLTSINYIQYDIKIVNENNSCLVKTWGTNGLYFSGGMNSLPGNIDYSDLSKIYIEFIMPKNVGNSIETKDLGSIPYIGKYGNKYIYKTSLKNISVHDNNIISINSLWEYDGCVEGGYSFFIDSNYTINNKVNLKNENNTNTALKFAIEGNFKGNVKAEEIEKNDIIYTKVLEQLKKYNSNNIYMNISNIYIEDGNFEGNLKLTFNVGTQYNGKYYNIVHMKNHYYEFEEFEGIVENGKIEIKVNSLSPFGIAISGEKENNSSNNEETSNTNNIISNNDNTNKLDETPKTGNIEIVSILSLLAVISLTGILSIKYNKK